MMEDYRISNIVGFLKQIEYLTKANKHVKEFYKTRGWTFTKARKIIKEHDKEIRENKSLINKVIDEIVKG